MGQRSQWGAKSVSLHLRNPEEGLGGGVLSFVKELWGARDLRGPDSQEVIESISKMLLCLEEMGG